MLAAWMPVAPTGRCTYFHPTQSPGSSQPGKSWPRRGIKIVRIKINRYAHGVYEARTKLAVQTRNRAVMRSRATGVLARHCDAGRRWFLASCHPEPTLRAGEGPDDSRASAMPSGQKATAAGKRIVRSANLPQDDYRPSPRPHPGSVLMELSPCTRRR